MTQHQPEHEPESVVAAMIDDPPDPGIHGLAEQVIAGLLAAGWTVAVAESLTGGGVCAALTQIPGASGCVRGAIVSYATDVKESVLDVDGDLLTRRGGVSS